MCEGSASFTRTNTPYGEGRSEAKSELKIAWGNDRVSGFDVPRTGTLSHRMPIGPPL
jgi:hypothetical protein